MRPSRTGLLAVFCLSGAAIGLQAQGNSEAAHLRALNGQLVRLHGLVQAATPAQANALRGQAAPLIAERADAFYLLIDQSPAEALSLAFSPDLLTDLARSFPDSASRLESHGQWQGLIEYSIATNPAMTVAKSNRRMTIGQQKVDINFAGPEPAGLKSGDFLSVSGVRAGNRVAAAGGSILGSSVAGASCSTTGSQSVVVLLVNFANYSLPAGVDADLLNGILFGNTFTTKTNTPNWSIDDFWQQGSDGQISLPFGSGAVKGPFTLPDDYLTCDSNAIFSAAVAAADSQVNFQNYGRVLIVMPNNSTSGSGCGWAGLGSLGCWSNSSPGDGTFTSSIAWLRADQMTNRSNGVRLISHEMGHNLTLHHASSRDFPGPPREPLGALGVAGTLNEYGDLFSTMGSWNFGFYSAQHAAEMLSWFSSPVNYQVVQSNGSYSVQAYETRPAGKKALKIQRGTGNSAWLWLEYRQNQGIYDSQLGSQVWSGALIHYADATTGTHTHLPDFTSATTSFGDPALAVGQTWTDPYSNLSISVDSAVSGTLNVTVTYGAVPCTQANPTVTLSPLNPTTQEGKPQNFTVSVTDNDSAGCSSGTFALSSTQPSAPAGWGSSFSPPSLTIAPGGTSTATLTKTPPTGSAGATYAVDAIATNAAFSGTGTDNVTVNLADFTISVTPSSRSVGQGGNTTYTVTVGALNGFTGNVALSVSGQPAGVTPTFNPTSINGSGNSTLTLAVGVGTATGTYTLTIRGDGPSTFHTANVTLIVTPPAPDFTISATPASQTVKRGGKAIYSVTLGRLNGFGSNVSLSVSNLPAKATASSSPNPVTNPNTSSTLTVTTASKGNGGTGTRTLTITGTAGGVTHTTTVNITVQ